MANSGSLLMERLLVILTLASHADVLGGSSRVPNPFPGKDCVMSQKNVCMGGKTHSLGFYYQFSLVHGERHDMVDPNDGIENYADDISINTPVIRNYDTTHANVENRRTSC